MLTSSTYFSQLYFIETTTKISRVAAYANVFTYSNKI